MTPVGEPEVTVEIDQRDAGGILVHDGAEAGVALAHRRLGALAVARGATEGLADVVDLAQAGGDRRGRLAAADGARRVRKLRDRAGDPFAGGGGAREGEHREEHQVEQDLPLPRPHRLRDDPGRHLDRGGPAVGEMGERHEASCIGERLQRRRSFGRRRDPLAQFGACQLVDETLRRLAARDHLAFPIKQNGDPVGRHIRAQDLAQVLGRQRAAQHQVTSADRIEHGDHITIADAAFEQVGVFRAAAFQHPLQCRDVARRRDRGAERHQRVGELRAVAAQQSGPAGALLQCLFGLIVERHIVAVTQRLRGRQCGELGTLDRELAVDVGREAARELEALALDLGLLLDQRVAILQPEEQHGWQHEAEREHAEGRSQWPRSSPEAPRRRI